MSKRRRPSSGRRVAEAKFWGRPETVEAVAAATDLPPGATGSAANGGATGSAANGGATGSAANGGATGSAANGAGRASASNGAGNGSAANGSATAHAIPATANGSATASGTGAANGTAGGHGSAPAPGGRLRIKPTPEPGALVRSLGPAPLAVEASVAERYLTAVYEEAVRTATALAAANGLLDAEPDDRGE